MDDYIQMSAELVDAKRRGDVARILQIVEDGGDLRAIDYREGWTLLHWAAHGGHAELARALLDRGADIECLDEEGQTPLMLAALQGHLDIIRLLLERGANPVAETPHGWDAASLAALRNQTAAEVVLRLAAGTKRSAATRKRALSRKEKLREQQEARDVEVACELFLARPENRESDDPLTGAWQDLGKMVVHHADGTMNVVSHGGRTGDDRVSRWHASRDGEFIYDTTPLGPAGKVNRLRWRLSPDGNKLTLTTEYGRDIVLERKTPGRQT